MADPMYEARLRRHNITATFTQRAAAHQAARMLEERLAGSQVETTTGEDETGVQYAEMRDELEGMVASPGLGSAMSKSQAQGASGGALAAGAVGVALGAIAGFIVNGAPGSEIGLLRWVFTWILVPAIAAGTFGMLAGGMLKSRYRPSDRDEGAPEEAGGDRHEHLPAKNGPKHLVHVRTDDESEFQTALGVLEELGPERLDRFNERGEVLATDQVGEGGSDASGPAPSRTVPGE